LKGRGKRTKKDGKRGEEGDGVQEQETKAKNNNGERSDGLRN
jgi:hypothetical protein